ncbi:hypothetical protein BDK51DRAFT_21152 [Blyttiomyces helicus]|uniref:enoyl-[acyl-carrier-protein] reductase n=1 Tax=Blyttiomyces helicus TaxID=388810 RepID=A0A4V1ISH8_9FUNG|nr:hypothetical protein BDK51DRAFT_21152 [Blyttiomyces helicus]|eukprot:RKO93607.1 hypothetical protein BDK51DRAFT_21152 [Blyttiomyces helicus]
MRWSLPCRLVTPCRLAPPSLRTILPRRSHSVASSSPALAYKSYGPPDKVIRLDTIPLPPLVASTVQVRVVAAPVNPADINQIQGTYPSKPNFVEPYGAVGGNEGLLQVVAVGPDVKGLKVGDFALPLSKAFAGTWRSQAQCQPDDLMRIDIDGVSPIIAATISVNPCTAYRMLKDFVDLSPGDVVIQNGANSGVGQAVIQIAKFRGLRTVNVIRNRPNLDEVANELKSMGADLVVSEEDVRKPDVAARIQALGAPPRLALNCVGGKSALNLSRMLGDNATLVTYGGMSREPLTFPTSPFIFKNLTCAGFWMTRWYKDNSLDARGTMLRELFQLAREGRLREPKHIVVRWGGDRDKAELERVGAEAVQGGLEGFGVGKRVLVME